MLSSESPAPPSVPTVAFQGEPGAFSELAIKRAWPDGARPEPCRTFDEALDKLTAGLVDFAMIPVENAIAGPVHAALAALKSRNAEVHQLMDVRVPVHLFLMAPAGTSLEELRVVRSHPVALAQCRYFLAQHPWLTPESYYDTAGAARDVATAADPTIGAVASEVAATQYHLEILARNVEDVPANWTRFVVVEQRMKQDVR